MEIPKRNATFRQNITEGRALARVRVPSNRGSVGPMNASHGLCSFIDRSTDAACPKKNARDRIVPVLTSDYIRHTFHLIILCARERRRRRRGRPGQRRRWVISLNSLTRYKPAAFESLRGSFRVPRVCNEAGRSILSVSNMFQHITCFASIIRRIFCIERVRKSPWRD